MLESREGRREGSTSYQIIPGGQKKKKEKPPNCAYHTKNFENLLLPQRGTCIAHVKLPKFFFVSRE